MRSKTWEKRRIAESMSVTGETLSQHVATLRREEPELSLNEISLGHPRSQLMRERSQMRVHESLSTRKDAKSSRESGALSRCFESKTRND